MPARKESFRAHPCSFLVSDEERHVGVVFRGGATAKSVYVHRVRDFQSVPG